MHLYQFCTLSPRWLKINGSPLKIDNFDKIEFDDGKEILKGGKATGSTIGVTVEELSNVFYGRPIREAFSSPIPDLLSWDNWSFDDTSISHYMTTKFKDVDQVDPIDMHNVKVMIERVHSFLNNEKPILFCNTAMYVNLPECRLYGIVDYITEDTIWDLKVTRINPRKNDFIQIYWYYYMYKNFGISLRRRENCVKGCVKDIANIKYIGIYNARKNIAYKMPVERLDGLVDDLDQQIEENIKIHGEWIQELKEREMESRLASASGSGGHVYHNEGYEITERMNQ